MREGAEQAEQAEHVAVDDAIRLIEVSQTVEVDVSLPWATWPRQSAVQARLSDVRSRTVEVDGERKIILHAKGEDIGIATTGGLRELSTRVGFPTDFVQKLDPDVQVAVLNNRLRDADGTRFNFIREQSTRVEDGLVVPDLARPMVLTNASPGWRQVTSHPDVAQTAWNILHRTFGGHNGGIKLVHAIRADDGLRLRIMTPWDAEIGPSGRSVGDVVSLGIDVMYKPGFAIKVSLYAEVLRCLNGMKAAENLFEWSLQTGQTEHQLTWVMVGIAEAVGQFDTLVANIRTMAETGIEGDPIKALLERARAMRMPKRFDDRLITAYAKRPEPTEWGMHNAFTDLATHGGIPVANAGSIQLAAGEWGMGFDIVTARLPRPLALSVGATIMEDGEVLS